MKTLRTSAMLGLFCLLFAGAARAESLGNSTCNGGAGTLSQDIYQAYLADTTRNGFSASMSAAQQAMVCSQVWAFVQFMASLVTPIAAPVTIEGNFTASKGQLYVNDPAANNNHSYIFIDNQTAGKESGIEFLKATVGKWWEYVPGGSNDLRFYDGVADRLTLTAGGAGPLTWSGYVQPLGANQSTASFNTAGALGGSCVAIDTTAAVGAGGALVFGANNGGWLFGVIKGYATNGGGNSQGGMSFETRLNQGDATLTEQFWIGPNVVEVEATSGLLFGGAASVAFLSLPASANGTLLYCNNCTIANPCAGGGTGAFAKRLNGIWICN